MITLLETLIGGAALLLMVPVVVLFVEVLLAVTQRERTSSVAGDHPRVAVLVPAHDEALIISRTLRTIVPQMARGDRLVVVADNCTDDTAALAATEGAEVLVRGDLLRRGKGYALDFGIRHLASDAPEIVLIIDADCRVRQGGIDRLARLSQRTGRPVQALYLMQAAEGASLKMRLAEFAWVIKNQVRPLGLHRLRLPCQLMGSGMAFPWACINSADLATGHIVEDLKLGIELAQSRNTAIILSCSTRHERVPGIKRGDSEPAYALGARPLKRNTQRSAALVFGFPLSPGRKTAGFSSRFDCPAACASHTAADRSMDGQLSSLPGREGAVPDCHNQHCGRTVDAFHISRLGKIWATHHHYW